MSKNGTARCWTIFCTQPVTSFLLSSCLAHTARVAVKLDGDGERGEDERTPKPVLCIKAEYRASVECIHSADKRQRTERPQSFPKQTFKMFSVHEDIFYFNKTPTFFLYL